MRPWIVEVAYIKGDDLSTCCLECEYWHEALSVAREIIDDYLDAVDVRVIDPRGWPQPITRPMLKM